MTDPVSGKIYVEISKALSNQQGAASIKLDLERLANEISYVDVGGNGSLIVVDSNRTIAAWSGAIVKGGEENSAERSSREFQCIQIRLQVPMSRWHFLNLSEQIWHMI